MEFDPLPDALNEPELEPAPEFALDSEAELELELLLAPLVEPEPEDTRENPITKMQLHSEV
jgi:hypothetical protein